VAEVKGWQCSGERGHVESMLCRKSRCAGVVERGGVLRSDDSGSGSGSSASSPLPPSPLSPSLLLGSVGHSDATSGGRVRERARALGLRLI
jgi:hypothetical protein